MVSHASIAVTDKGMELLSLLVSTTTPRSLGKKNTTSSSSSSSSKIEWMAISQACIKFVVKCPDPSRRSHCWKTWSSMLKAFSLTTEFELLRQLVAICPHNNIVGMLIDATTKNCITLVQELIHHKHRERALLELSKKREALPDLAPILWHSFGTVAVLLQEIVSIYPLLTPSRSYQW